MTRESVLWVGVPPVSVTVFQLLQWKYAIKLEGKGIKVARRSVRAHAARILQCKRIEVAGRIQAILDQLEEVQS